LGKTAVVEVEQARLAVGRSILKIKPELGTAWRTVEYSLPRRIAACERAQTPNGENEYQRDDGYGEQPYQKPHLHGQS
jgi:hypothetical protein